MPNLKLVRTGHQRRAFLYRCAGPPHSKTLGSYDERSPRLFNTRPKATPSVPPPPRGPEVIAAAMSRDGTADVHVVRRPDGHYTYVVEAWTNFPDAGGNPHYTWHTFHSPTGLITDSYDTAVSAAVQDAQSRGLEIEALSATAA